MSTINQTRPDGSDLRVTDVPGEALFRIIDLAARFDYWPEGWVLPRPFYAFVTVPTPEVGGYAIYAVSPGQGGASYAEVFIGHAPAHMDPARTREQIERYYAFLIRPEAVEARALSRKVAAAMAVALGE